ncbi:hypothetical protein H1Q63_25130 [Desmonostoc muscorum CCALA 125]|nr:hypothetical protein [Desmonostoc muscorum CCALA 125]
MRLSFSTGLLVVGIFSPTKWVLRVRLHLKMRSLLPYQILLNTASYPLLSATISLAFPYLKQITLALAL